MGRTNKDQVWERIASSTPFFVAEIGKNFIQSEEGVATSEYLKNAKDLIDAAVQAGADAVKFQTHHLHDEQAPVRIISPHFNGADRYSWVKRNSEIASVDFWRELKTYSNERGVLFFSTPMSRGAAMQLAQVGVPLWKVGSGDLLDFVLLDWLRQRDEPIIISSGMSTLTEVDRAVGYLLEKTNKVVLMHCVSKYPCDPQDLHLGVVPFFQRRFGLPIAFSDHSIGLDAALHAVSLGAVVIEKHFSLDRGLWGSDHKVSMLPQEFAEMIYRARKKDLAVQNSEQYMGVKITDDLPDRNSQFRKYFRKTLVASRAIHEGEKIQPEMLYAMRPQAFLRGLPSEKYSEIIGSVATRNIPALVPITAEDVAVRELVHV